jgi:hypothetical protein
VSAEINEVLRRSARMHREIQRRQREAQPPGLLSRIYEAFIDCIVAVTLLVLAVDGWIAYQTFY